MNTDTATDTCGDGVVGVIHGVVDGFETGPPGIHVLSWAYAKDGTVDTGGDRYYIDDISVGGLVTEECDDGNNVDGNGCSWDCQWE